MKEIEKLGIGQSKSYPIKRIMTIRVYVSTLNQIHYHSGRRWNCLSNKKASIVVVTRLS